MNITIPLPFVAAKMLADAAINDMNNGSPTCISDFSLETPFHKVTFKKVTVQSLAWNPKAFTKYAPDRILIDHNRFLESGDLSSPPPLFVDIELGLRCEDMEIINIPAVSK